MEQSHKHSENHTGALYAAGNNSRCTDLSQTRAAVEHASFGVRSRYRFDNDPSLDQIFCASLLETMPEIGICTTDNDAHCAQSSSCSGVLHSSTFQEHIELRMDHPDGLCDLCATSPSRAPRLVIHAARIGQRSGNLDPFRCSALSRPALSPDADAVVFGITEPDSSNSQGNRLIHVSLQPDPSSQSLPMDAASGGGQQGSCGQGANETYQWWACALNNPVQDLVYARRNTVLLGLSTGHVAALHTTAESLGLGPDMPPRTTRLHRDAIREIVLTDGNDCMFTISHDGQVLLTSIERLFAEASGAPLASADTVSNGAEIGRVSIGRPTSSVRPTCTNSSSKETCTVTTDDGALYLVDMRMPTWQAAICVLETKRDGLFAHDHEAGDAPVVLLGYADGLLSILDFRTFREIGRYRESPFASVGDIRSVGPHQFISFGSPTAVMWSYDEKTATLAPDWHMHPFRCEHQSEPSPDAFIPGSPTLAKGDLHLALSMIALTDTRGYLSLLSV